jgi:hypothetical protein
MSRRTRWAAAELELEFEVPWRRRMAGRGEGEVLIESKPDSTPIDCTKEEDEDDGDEDDDDVVVDDDVVDDDGGDGGESEMSEMLIRWR